jgi:predicted metal-binding protein
MEKERNIPKTKRIPESERGVSDLMLHREANITPKTQTRPATKPKSEIDMKDLDELVEVAKRAIEELSKRSRAKPTGDACIIKTEDIVIEPRVRWKCIIPICFGYGTSPCCPPGSPTAEQMQEIVSSYKYAILIRYSPTRIKTAVAPAWVTDNTEVTNDLNEIVTIVEAEAGYMGYYLAMGFKGGPCLTCGVLSPEWLGDWIMGKEVPGCAVNDGRMCNRYLKARPALEACGVDVFATAKKAGWEEQYHILPEHPKKSVPCISWHGMVLVS